MQIVNLCPECGSCLLSAQKKTGFNKLYKCEACDSLLKAESESKSADIYIAGLLLIISILFLSVAVFFVIIRNIFTHTYVVKIVKPSQQ
jgi:hypothetical protein